MTESVSEARPSGRRLLVLVITLTAVCGLLVLVPALVLGWMSGSSVNPIPPKSTVADATEEVERLRDPIIEDIQARAPLNSRPEIDYATRKDLVEGPSSSTEDVSCGISLIAHGFSITSTTYFSSPEQPVLELLLITDMALSNAGFAHTREATVEEVTAEIGAYIEGGAEGPRPQSLHYELDSTDMRATLRYDAPGEQLALIIHGPCYRQS
ncbi:hypothetical protein [Glycomyces sp. NRRL B-16210]|uniref:hypothetical protein n=1 Tax=Glycomyces sp. NRRL B-16210 TaxID=1463821 RepID=UPI0004BF525A|nr:hypothetical protein [Glycomyces sp. NRRL B-16210]